MPSLAAASVSVSSTPQTSLAYFAKRSGSSGHTYFAQDSQTADRLAPWATSYLALSSWPILWGPKSVTAPRPVRPLWERLLHHMSSLMAS